MKTAKLVLSLVAVGLAVGALVCAVIAYWENLTEVLASTKQKVTSRINARKGLPEEDDAFADFVDVAE